MRLARLLRHALATHWRTRLLFPSATQDAIQEAIRQAERAHDGQIRFAIETALTPLHVWHGVGARARAIEVFATLRVWDTERNNGVLVYVLLADRSVEIIADRGFRDRVDAAEWEAVCRVMESHFRERHFKSGAVAGVEAVGKLISRHYPTGSAGGATAEGGAGRAGSAGTPGSELPDRPALL